MRTIKILTTSEIVVETQKSLDLVAKANLDPRFEQYQLDYFRNVNWCKANIVPDQIDIPLLKGCKRWVLILPSYARNWNSSENPALFKRIIEQWCKANSISVECVEFVSAKPRFSNLFFNDVLFSYEFKQLMEVLSDVYESDDQILDSHVCVYSRVVYDFAKKHNLSVLSSINF
jgi:hypothetical protein